ncbi:hypothetical protein ACFYVL_06180 [Streptomyces sp. NPDC004111]|uniref:hypothetical protein n=1 Tax=Streptomyces sp. NPDC004111 TaxID=3364690 RepID=UPI00367D2376
MKPAVLIAATGTVAAAAFLGVVAVPAVHDWFDSRHEESASYATGTAAKQARASVPRWLPDTAEGISYAMRTTGGDRLLKASLPAASALPPTCKKIDTKAAPVAPALQADWFPENARDKATHRCDLYYSYTDGDTLYAWQQNDDWISSNKASAGH